MDCRCCCCCRLCPSPPTFMVLTASWKAGIVCSRRGKPGASRAHKMLRLASVHASHALGQNHAGAAERTCSPPSTNLYGSSRTLVLSMRLPARVTSEARAWVWMHCCAAAGIHADKQHAIMPAVSAAAARALQHTLVALGVARPAGEGRIWAIWAGGSRHACMTAAMSRTHQ